MSLLERVLVRMFCMSFAEDGDDEQGWPVSESKRNRESDQEKFSCKNSVQQWNPESKGDEVANKAADLRDGIFTISKQKNLNSISGNRPKPELNSSTMLIHATCPYYCADQNNNSTNNAENMEEELEGQITPSDISIERTLNYERFQQLAAAVSSEETAPEDEEITKNIQSEGTIQVRCGRKRKRPSLKKASSRKLKHDFALKPLKYTKYGRLMQRGRGGKPKYTDVASIIDLGTIAHANIDTLLASKHNVLVTLDSRKTMTKEKLYYVKPIQAGAFHLEDLMSQDSKRQLFSEEEAKFVCANLLLALRFLHRYNIIHGSICPRKIVISDKGYPYLGYFNTAERIGKRQSRPRERIPIEYSAPEHIMSRVYANTDEYLLAIVIYEMIFGRVPHLGESYAKTRTNLSRYDFIPEFDRSKISSKGQRFLTYCLRGHHRERFNLLEVGQGQDLFQTLRWFKKYNENLIYLQTVDSPLKRKIQQVKGGKSKTEVKPGPSTAPD